MLRDGLLEGLPSHLRGNLRDQAAWADDRYRLGLRADLDRRIALIVPVDDGIDDHLLDRQRVVRVYRSRNLCLEPELEIDQR